MIKLFFTSWFIVCAIQHSISQEITWKTFNQLEGKWQGSGSGFSGGTSVIHSEFNFVMDGLFMEIKNHSEFAPSEENQKGDIHDDWGIISFDKTREKFVFRQFHSEGFYNQYILNDTLSNPKFLVFETEFIENFVDGGTARFTIILISENKIETVFDVGFPGREMTCYGKNKLIKLN